MFILKGNVNGRMFFSIFMGNCFEWLKESYRFIFIKFNCICCVSFFVLKCKYVFFLFFLDYLKECLIFIVNDC